MCIYYLKEKSLYTYHLKTLSLGIDMIVGNIELNIIDNTVNSLFVPLIKC